MGLFSASITLAGFIAVFLVFRYRQADIYVDNTKGILRSLLENEIRGCPKIAVRIQDIWKDPERDDIAFFSCFKNEAVNEFVKHILGWRILRRDIVWLGLASIWFWVVLSLFYVIYVISPWLFSCIGCPAMMIWISIYSFIKSMALTLFFVFYSLRAKRPE
jgi:hypothetical protein